MKVKLYGLPTCSRCRTAQMMLKHRNIKYEYIMATKEMEDLPILNVDGKVFSAKEALLKIRGL